MQKVVIVVSLLVLGWTWTSQGLPNPLYNTQEKFDLRVKRSVPVPDVAEHEGSGDDTPLFSESEACKAAPDAGPCFGFHQRYYYNSSSMSCELFNYGGCLGNQNKFVNERECLQRCRTEGEE
ncbi:hypothetical protein PAMA_007927 [Pampus argenteus]